ncbi:hypothetical protein [Candidatus Protochlamydia sp. W-9]|uniref:hypothetical protein n=1 Tax=Candidatus Protochlamydia sp. W-9 TaxID=1785087 RepID=UPI00096A7B23|nr:hypothetical protein [Candidatus Protochlamydia sp. W-9]
MSAKKNEIIDPKSYACVFGTIKKDIQESQLRAAMSTTKDFTALYCCLWCIGNKNFLPNCEV